MKFVTSISARWPIVALFAVTLSFVVIGTALSAGVIPAVTPYNLLGDTTNTGASTTNFNSPSSGDAWKFAATGSSATALIGECLNGSACWGVQGKGTGIGVYGTASSPTTSDTRGVQGSGGTTAASGISYGGYFTATNSASGGKAYGVYASGATDGLIASSAGDGVKATSTSPSGNGVHATGSGASFYGVWGDADGKGFGVVGTSSGGNGVYGSSTGSTSSARTAGIYGFNTLSALGAASFTNSGVYGTCVNCGGVVGSSANYVGVRGTATGNRTSTYGGYFTSKKGTGVYASTTAGTTAFRAVNVLKDSSHYAGVFDGNVRINGNYVATGTKSAVVETSEGDKLMYAEEATQNYFSDQGVATLKRGRLVLKLDSLFAETVDLSKPYMVIVTPMSFDTTGLGVGNLKATSFEVRELNRGTGNITFSWRVTALRKGYANARMATAPGNPASDVGTLPTTASSVDTLVTDPSFAPPTAKQAPAYRGYTAPQAK